MVNSKVLGDRYELAELLGQGGMAEVYRARDLRLGRNVAVKILRTDLARDPSFERRFAREAQACAGMNHPNVVAVFDTGAQVEGDTTIPYIVMEYVDGTTLKDLLLTGRRLLPQRALEITAGVLGALEYSHQQGIIHRDIKPANIMLTRTGEVKVMDFGIARALDDAQATMTQASTVMGTAQYLSPEQGRGETADARSDVYATGCLLYELLTSRPPFVGDTTASVVYQHVRENPIPPSQIDPEVSASADAVVLKAMSKNPENRYQTAGEMRSDVLRAVDGEPVRATPVMEQTTAVAPMAAYDSDDRRRAKVRGYIAIGLGVVGALVLGFFLIKPLLVNTVTYPVPDLTGQTVAQATVLLKDAKFELGTVTEAPSDAVPQTIISQTPAIGAEAQAGSAINVTISTGPAKAIVPAIKNLSLDEASRLLSEAGLKLGTKTLLESDAPVNQVLDSDPAEGTSVDSGSVVNVTISSGAVVVPDVRGATQADATAELESSGFRVLVTKSKTNEVPPGTVVKQSPIAGVKAKNGSTVTITVAEAAPAPSPTPTTTTPPITTPPATP
ncbi:MAG: Stk1 family PASTA domain-containing Ser/Thr kinase [Actinobacteria bacterium]|nr:Stk1 family PASTA domain-containing Ser/Thr kinase [Actinomycetota bacterium]